MDPATYEHLRNKTLLFFIEKLLDPSHGNTSNTNNNNNQVSYTNKRTLHDLSCQFGSKGFTKEMRQIAGGSQSGLKKFLQSYPSIFKIESDVVSYNVNSTILTTTPQPDNEQDSNDNNVPSSIDNEAVEYFRERLMQYGIGIWVPVKSLLGHRSQAPPHIRHVSGQHIREFTSFLSKYPSTFIINPQDEVLLKEFENYYNENKDNPHQQISKNIIDKKRIVELIEFYANCLVERGPMLVEQLFCAGNLKYDDDLIINSDEESLWEYFKSPNDLCTFFKMYPQCFQVHSNLVTFSDTYKVGLEYLKRQSGGIIIPQATTPLPKPLQIIKKPEVKKLVVPKQEPVPQPQQQPQKSLLKQRVSKILLQTINQNTEHDYKHDLIQKKSKPDTTSNQFKILCESGDTEELRNYIISRTVIVSNQRKASSIIEELVQANEVVSLDFEGVNLGNDGVITLVQVGTLRGSVYIFDVLTQPGLIESGGGLVKLLEGGNGNSDSVVKVMHDCRNDSVNLYRQFGIRLRNVFDTQVAHIVINQEQQKNGSVTKEIATEEVEETTQPNKSNNNNTKNISLNNLCSLYGAVSNPFKDKVKSVYRHDQKYWSRRPLTKQMIAYASCDVMCLVPGIYETLKNKINSSEQTILFNELCEEQILTHIEPDEIRSRRRLRKNESDLKGLRGKLDKAFELGGVSNSNLVLSNREMRLLKHLNLTEEEKERLKLSLKVAKKLEKMSSNSPSLYVEAAGSSDSTSNSELTSLEYNSNQDNNNPAPVLMDPRIAQIDSLEAIIDRLISDNKVGGDDDREEEEQGDEEIEGTANKREFVIGEVIASSSMRVREFGTQTISTGDIVITKVYDD